MTLDLGVRLFGGIAIALANDFLGLLLGERDSLEDSSGFFYLVSSNIFLVFNASPLFEVDARESRKLGVSITAGFECILGCDFSSFPVLIGFGRSLAFRIAAGSPLGSLVTAASVISYILVRTTSGFSTWAR